MRLVTAIITLAATVFAAPLAANDELAAALAALQQNNPKDASAAIGALPGQVSARQSGDELAAALAALQQNNPDDADAAKGILEGRVAPRQNDDLAAALAALQQNNSGDAAAAVVAGVGRR
ncbi:hypothetical protein GGTG_05657 [Gaeumannomyces tritici R3-111a-1]|uniref:Uncharacterized protein n=1 Tax=Gaeumannomyces tritici (strain R3-111a-1) TaxID=644352 RepID=J3NWJ4_GAET3|nr:hypothetical protein GGTG_05657 [Gaeumannomyces tritici R3-111a-1]EJT75726.1 hypothetical protein GGTG_05657 [Gaeumannomyces tritici R3-111a-1]